MERPSSHARPRCASACCCSGELGQVVGGADQRPFVSHLFEAAEQELSEPSSSLDLTEDRLDHLLAQSVAAAPAGTPEPQAHGRDQRTPTSILAAVGVLIAGET